jgi:hypothetical protein
MAQTTQTTMRLPPLRASNLDPVIQQWLLAVSRLHPLIECDTSGGNFNQALPPAGLSSTATGETNLNQEIIYVKISPDANTVTITGAQGGNVILAAQYDKARFKSNGTVWYRVG